MGQIALARSSVKRRFDIGLSKMPVLPCPKRFYHFFMVVRANVSVPHCQTSPAGINLGVSFLRAKNQITALCSIVKPNVRADVPELNFQFTDSAEDGV
jgi:hypothetical protein